MAIETEFSHRTPRPETLDHSSISFGRFTSESLAWEKWSVFSHNRDREELEKFNFPGFVAQKKAFFEEYYSTIRMAKTLPVEQRDLGSQILARAEVHNDLSLVKDESEDSFRSGKEVLHTKNATVKSDRSSKEGFLGISRCAQDLDSNPAKHVPSKLITKGIITKREARCKKDGNIESERKKASQREAEISRVVSGKSRILKAENRIYPVRVSSDKKNDLIYSSDGKSSQLKKTSNVRDEIDKSRRSIMAHKQSPQFSLKKFVSDDLHPRRTDKRLKNPTPMNEVNRKTIGSSRRSSNRETKREELQVQNKDCAKTRIASKSFTTTPSSKPGNLKSTHKVSSIQLFKRTKRNK